MKRTTTYIWAIIAAAGLILSASCPAQADRIKIAVIDSGATDHVDSAVSFTSFPVDADPLNHGTVVAGLIREESPDAEIHMLQVTERAEGKLKPSREAVIAAIEWAVDNEIDIVNMSWVAEYDEKVRQAIDDASFKHGILFVAASGNKKFKDGYMADEDGFIRRTSKAKLSFPASSEQVISVGARDFNGNVADYSSADSDVYASGDVHKRHGTSFACARVSGRIANLLAEVKSERSVPQILSLLK